VGVDGGGVEASVPEQGLDGLEPGAGLDEMGGEGVPQRARSDVLQDAGLLQGGAEGALDAGGGDRLSGDLALDQVALRPVRFPAPTQFQALREQHLAVLVPLAALDADQHALGVDVVGLEVHDLVGAQAGAVAEHEGGLVLEAGRGFEDRLDLLRAQHLGQPLGPAPTRQARVVPVVPLQDLLEEAAQRVSRHTHARVAQPARGHVRPPGRP
jgi:hypothetical protein